MGPTKPSWVAYDGGSLELRCDEVHLWSINLDVQGSTKGMEDTLSEEELYRSKKFKSDKDVRRFILSHGIMRAILSIYLDAKPKDVPITATPKGKLEIDEKIVSPKNLFFSLSHSGGLAFVAVALNHRVGVDAEYLRHDFPALEVARHFFSEREIEDLETKPGKEGLEAFYRMWTRKEAYLKATGEGLSGLRTTDSMDFTNNDIGFKNSNKNISRKWIFFDIRQGSNFISLAVEGTDLVLRMFKWRM